MLPTRPTVRPAVRPPAVRRAFLAALLSGAALLVPGASAQDTRALELPVEQRVDSGLAANRGSEPSVVLAFVVRWPGADSLRLHFGEVLLAGDIDAGSASVLRLTSLADGAQQLLDTATLAQWRGSSAYFNGDSVLVDVLAQPGTGDNRVVVERLSVGLPPLVQKTICFTTDDRVPSDDPRVSRVMPVACTSWMIQDCGHCFLTAGHCVGTIDTVEYHVPKSLANGSLQHPPPSDQYAIDAASIQSNGGQGVGNDFAYFGTFPNSNTGLTAWQAEGAAFELVAPPASTAGQSVRVTGHGTDSTPDSTYNQIQQTHVGPLTAVFGTTVQYQVDTTGGNSGSPIIWENTDQAIGIHTHAGCGTTGGANQGTSSQLAALQAAIANPLGTCASSCGWEPLGGGLAGSFGIPVLTGQGLAVAGGQVGLHCQVVKLFSTSTLVAGLSALQAGFKGGVLVPAPDFVVAGIATGVGIVDIGFDWPASVPAGTEVWWQLWIADPAGPKGWAASTALKSVSS